MFHVKHLRTYKLHGAIEGEPGMALLGTLALVGVLALGAAAFGPALAAECAFVGVVEEALCTGLFFNLLCAHYGIAGEAIRKIGGTERSAVASGSIGETVHAAIPSDMPKRLRKASLLTALVFALCHLAQPWKLPIAFVFSLCMIRLYRATGTLAWPICAHAAFDMLWFGFAQLP